MIRERPARVGRVMRSRGAGVFGVLPAEASGSGRETHTVSFGGKFQISLLPNNAVGSNVPTFTRNLASYAIDFEGRLVSVPANAARMQGTRIVKNFIEGSSNNLTNASWGVFAGGATVVYGAVDPLGGNTASTVTFASGVSFVINAGGNSSAHYTVGSVWARSVSGTVKFRIDLLESAVADHFSPDITVSPTWQRYSFAFNNTGTSGAKKLNLVNDAAGDAHTVVFWGAQLEYLEGQTNQNPSETVSVGVLSAPFHGLGVDGIKSFDTLNGNTVASNVVTEATGAHIDSSQAAAAGGVTAGVVDATGPLGLLVEGAAQNLRLRSHDFTTGWTFNAGSAGALTTGPDGLASATPMIAGVGAGVNVNTTATIAISNVTVYSETFILKNGNLGSNWVEINPGATSNWRAWFNLATGAKGSVSGAGVSNSIKALGGGWYACTITFTSDGVTDSTYIFATVADNSNTEPATGDGAKIAFYIWNDNFVAGSVAGSPILTTTVAVTRPASVSQYVSAGNIASTMTLAMDITPTTALGSATVFHWATYVDADNYTALLSDGTNLIARKRISGSNHDATIAWSRTVGTTIRAVPRFDSANGVDIWLDHVKGANDATTTAAQIGTNWENGGDGNGANQDYCMHRIVAVYCESTSDSFCASL